MTILFDQVIHEFDPDPKFAEWERAQPSGLRGLQTSTRKKTPTHSAR